MNLREIRQQTPWYFYVVAALILCLSLGALNFSHTLMSHGCGDDECLHVTMLSALLLLAIQILVCIPVFIFLSYRAGKLWLLVSVIWILISIGCIIPIFFVDLGDFP